MIVVAGPGYGKSTLLAQALAEHEGPSVWLSCDERLRGADAFVGHLIEGIDRLFPGVGQRLLHHGAPADLVTELCNELVEAVADDFLIVIDDAHVLHGHPAGEALGLLVRDLPPNVHLAVASRMALPIADARTRAGGVVSLDEGALALTRDESIALLRRSDPRLDAAAIEDLHLRTEGWVAGLILAARAGPGTTSAVPRQDVFEFLAQEVLSRQPDDVQRFLLDTAIFERFTPALAEAVNERSGAALVIQWLVENRLFCVPLEDDGPDQWYRYHHLFQAFLRGRLREEEPERAVELNRRAGVALQSAGEPLEAIPHLLAAGEVGAVVDALEPLAESLVRSPQAGALREWLAAIPESVRRERPSLVLAEASLLFVDARSEEAAFDALDTAIDTLLSVGDHERAALVLARLIQARVPGDLGLARGVEVAARYVPRIDPTARMLPVARILLAGGHGWACRFDEAERELDEALALPAVERFPLARTYAAIVRAHFIERIRGRVSEAPDALEAAIRVLEHDPSDEELGFLVYASGYRAFALSYVGRHEEALTEIERQAAAAVGTGQTGVAQDAADWIRMVAFVELGRWDDLERELRNVAEGHFREWAMGYYFHAERARLFGHRGDRGGVRSEVAAARRMMQAHLGGVDFNALCDLSLAASAAGLVDDALALAREAHDVAAASSAAWGRARAALIVAHCDGSDDGDAALAEALELTRTWGYEELWYRKERQCATALLARALAGRLGPPGFAEGLAAICGGEVLEGLLHDPRPVVRAAGSRVHRLLAGGPRLALQIEGFGEFIVRRGGITIPQAAFGRDRARALLAALACAGGPVPRDRLLEWFWPDLSPERGTRAFRTALYALRRALEPDRPRFDSASVIRLDAEVCQLSLGDGDSIDAHEFLRAAAPLASESDVERIDRLRRADALVRGALFPEWPYAEWAADLRMEVDVQHRRVLAELAGALIAVGHAAEAGECFRRLLVLEPECEEWHRGRMRTLADSGELALALRQYHVCRSILQRELAIMPSAATRDLYGELLARSG